MIDEIYIVLASFLLRIVLGILLVSQGYEKFFRIGIKEVVQTVANYEWKLNLPNWLIGTFVFVNSFIEFFGGLFLIFGLMKSYVMFAVGFNFIFVAAALSLNSSMWDMKHFFPRLILFIALLLVPSQFDQWTLNYFFG